MAKKVSFFGIAIALAMIFSYIEILIPINFGIPGFKLGLSNIVILVLLYHKNAKVATLINLARIGLTALLFTNITYMLYSLIGGIFSLIVMILAKRVKSISIIGVSILGAISHNIGQLIMAVFIINSIFVLTYIPVLLFAGLLTGVLTGILSNIILNRLNIKQTKVI